MFDERNFVTIAIAAISGGIGAIVSHVKIGGRVSTLEENAGKTETAMVEMRGHVTEIKENLAYIRGTIDSVVKD